MTFEQYAWLGEIIAAIAVIASLFYVARQLGQNTAMMRVSAASERMERDYELVLPVIENREFAEIWMKGGENFEDLDVVDQQRLLLFERRAIILWHHVYQLRQQGLCPDANWQEQVWVIQQIGRRQAIRVAWDTFKGAFETPFQEFVNNEFALVDGEVVNS